MPMPADVVQANACLLASWCRPAGTSLVLPGRVRPLGALLRHEPRPPLAPGTLPSGQFGSTKFKLHHPNGQSFWHDIPLKAVGTGNLYNVVIEIPMFSTANWR